MRRALLIPIAIALLAAGLSTPVDARVAAVVERARQEGLPTASLVSKAREGAAKGVAPERVLATVTAMADELSRARNAVGTSDPAVLPAAARALDLGVSESECWRLAAGDRGPAVLTAAGDLVERGMPVSSAIPVAELLELGPEVDLASLELAALRLAQSHVPSDQIAALLRQDIASGEVEP